ncbi:MAG TPA: 2-hydroxyglutaryl-CoA dehydratase [Candidatus Cloacimonas sp.]|jgi:predicted CoA-substrate-specific enzyme activase|nr:2-hydroxyglutaryl-CoA dehydratase [Candidatus Cloacimonas sp.]
MITLGIDVGSRNTKLIIFDHTKQSILFQEWIATNIDPTRSIEQLYTKALTALKLPEQSIAAKVATGYGRKIWPLADKVISEISAHAAGIAWLRPEARTIIDIGGQDSKVIALDSQGKVFDFAMNDKCAAGTGRFLEMTAMRLGIEVSQLSDLAADADIEIKLNNTCVVFAETEIISLMASKVSAANIVRAVHRSIAKRIFSQMSALTHQAPYVFTGGVAQNQDLANCISMELGSELWIPPEPEITAALGAAILAKP